MRRDESSHAFILTPLLEGGGVRVTKSNYVAENVSKSGPFVNSDWFVIVAIRDLRRGSP